MDANQQMTWEKWLKLSRQEKDNLRDTSDLHPQLVGLEGKKVRVTPKRKYGASTFRISLTTGWKPSHLAVRGNALSSSDLIHKDEVFTSIRVLEG